MAVHVDIIAELQERSVRRAADRLEREFNNVNANVGVDVKAAEIRAAAAKIQREFSDIRQEIKIDVDDAGIRRATRSMGDFRREGSKVDSLIQEIGTTAFRTSRGLMTLGGPLVLKGLVDLASVAVTASQSIALLPAVAAAGGAALGTLALATSGVGDALDAAFDPKKRLDPEKFAAAIQSLSPAAQQAVLSLQALLPQFDALKNATQDTFFAGISDQIQNLSKIYLPQVQTLTTGIAGAFNQALSGVGNLLAAPGTQAQIKSTMDNIVLAFQNAAPAAQSFSQAFIDIMQVGSEFLPGFGTGIANMAQEFANFIREARDSGQLKIWIQEGIDAVAALSQALVDLTKLLYEAFGSDPQGNIQRLRDDIATTSEILKLLSGDTHQLGISWREELDSMYGPLGKLRDGIMDIPEALAVVGNKAIDMANIVNHAINAMAQNAQNFLAFLNPFGGAGAPYQPIPDIPHLPSGGDWSNYQTPIFGRPGWGGQTIIGPNGPQQIGGTPPGPTIPVAPGQNRTSRPGPPPLPGPPPGSVYGVPAAPPTGPAGRKPSDKDRRDAIAAGLDPNSYRIDPFAQVPGLPPGVAPLPKGAQGPMGMGTGTPYGGGTYTQDPQKILEAQHAVESAGHDLEEARKDRLVLERDNQASAEEISDAKWKETEAGWKLQSEQADLAAAIQGTYNKTSDASNSLASAMGELGAGLDKDLGISKGLPGLADNIVRFLGNLALAPMMAQMAMTKATSPSQGGYGLMGILGAQGAFGPMFTGLNSTTGGATGASQYSYSPSAMGPAVLQPYASGFTNPNVNAMLNLAQAASGKTDYAPASDLINGLADCSGSISDLYEILKTGQATAARSFTTTNFASDAEAAKLGFLPGFQPGALNVGVNPYPGMSGHMAATLPNGVNFEGGGGTGGGAQYGGSASGALDPQFERHYYLPINNAIQSYQSTTSGPTGPSLYSPENTNPALNLPGYAGGGFVTTPDPVTDILQANIGQYASASTGAVEAFRQNAPMSFLYGPPAKADYQAQLQTGTGKFNPLYKNSGLAPGNLNPNIKIDTSNAGLGSYPWYEQAWQKLNYMFNFTHNTPWLRANGGGLPGFGGGDRIPLLAEGGEFIVNKDAARQFGPLLQQLNRYQVGGPVERTRIGGLAPIAPNPGGGGIGITPGGSIDTAANLAAMAFPGVGQAAATGMKLASRAIQYAGQVAGIGLSGLMETFLPTGGSELANNNWLTRMAGALAGAAPALPNIAGGAAGQAQMQGQPAPSPLGPAPPPITPGDVSTGQGTGAPPGPNIELNYTNNGATEDRAGADITNHLRTQYTPPGRQYGG